MVIQISILDIYDCRSVSLVRTIENFENSYSSDIRVIFWKFDGEVLLMSEGYTEILTCPAHDLILKTRNLGYITLGSILEKLKTFNYILTSGLKVNDLDHSGNSCARQFLPVDTIISDLESKRQKIKVRVIMLLSVVQELRANL